MRAEVDVVVVGAGVVGLAAAAALARRGRSVCVLEREAGFARGVTSRSSEVVHAGIYYARGSLKAELCVAGREALYARCARHRIPHRRLGKLIVACDRQEVRVLEDLLERGRGNGAPGLELIDGAAVRRLEPEVVAEAALWSPESGIVDAHALALSFVAEAEQHGADLLLRSEVEAVERSAGLYRLAVRDASAERTWLTCAALVNAAGLGAERVARLLGLDVDALGYRLHPCKGDYFALRPGAPLRLAHLVYPVPAEAGLGIHATLDMGGRVRFGPDAQYVCAPRYDVDPGKASDFARAVRRYLPALEPDSLVADYAGVRPRLSGPGEPPRDFVVREESAAGLPGVVSLVGIESPGLTAAPAIAERVADLLAGA